MYIRIDKSKCVGCNACIRVCPVEDVNKASMEDSSTHSIVNINRDRCISCGECVKSCQHNARYYLDDTEAFFEALKNGRKLTVIVAPAFRVTAENGDAILNMLRKLGVSSIYDVSFGADICTYAHIRAIEKGMVGKVISQPCAALTEYILKHRPEAIKYLSPVHSPMSCMAIFLRKSLGVTDDIAVISPCAAKKQEFAETGTAQYNITFNKLVAYMAENYGALASSSSFEFDNLPAFCGKIYPRPGGLKACLNYIMPSLNVVNSEGTDTVYSELDNYLKTDDAYKPEVFDVLSCKDGCISGVGTCFSSDKLLEFQFKLNKIEKNSFNDRKKQEFLKKDKQYAWFDKNININDYLRKYTPQNADIRTVSEQELERAFLMLNKSTENDRHFDCRACGYKSCYEMATAIARQNNVPNNCHQYVSNQALAELDEIKDSHTRVQRMNNQINDIVGQITRNLVDINDSSSTMAKQCEESDDQIAALMVQVSQMKEKCIKIIDAANRVDEISNNYREMSEKIKAVTSQTHLLSLNASVEAVRAGEEGKSFSVIASEIRNLATTTRNTTNMVEKNDLEIKTEIANVNTLSADVQQHISLLISTVETLEAVLKDASSTGLTINKTAASVMDTANSLSFVTERLE